MSASNSSRLYERALTELYALSNRGIKPGLQRVRAALKCVGDPQDAFEVVHIAGTNGKGSVASMVGAGLSAYRVGLFTSPHLHRLSERFGLRSFGVAHEAAEVESLIGDIWAEIGPRLLGPEAPALTFFEAITVLALSLFKKSGCEIVVLETGLGGRLDSTNIIERPLLTAITHLDLDHTAILGPDLKSVAAEKAGILKPSVPCVLAPQRPEARAVVHARAQELDVPLLAVEDSSFVPKGRAFDLRWGTRSVQGLEPGLVGAHQLENAAVATLMLWKLEELGTTVDVSAGVGSPQWPGRLESTTIDGTAFLFDAAHNPSGCRALAQHLRATPLEGPVEGRPRRCLLFGAMADKDTERMVDILSSEVSAIVYGKPAGERAADPGVLRQAQLDAYRAASLMPDRVEPDGGRALQAAIKLAGEGQVIVTGSLHWVAEIRALLLGIEADPPIRL